jgi:hypothetical protein
VSWNEYVIILKEGYMKKFITKLSSLYKREREREAQGVPILTNLFLGHIQDFCFKGAC